MPPVPPPPSAHPAVWSIQELTEQVNAWCEENHVAPANGQAAERLTERNVRYYRARGLLDAPGLGGGPNGPLGRRGFTEKHAAQLKAIRVLQARGVPLSRIEDQLRGRSTEELQALERKELRKPNANGATAGFPAGGGALDSLLSNGHGATGGPAVAPPAAGAGQENWLVSALGEDFLLVSRRGQTISDEQRRLLVAVLRA